MTCQEFTEHLPDYLDDTPGAFARTDANRHLEACRECQLAWQRARDLGCALQGALERETAHLTLARGTRAAILQAARAPTAAPSVKWNAWRWLKGHPLGALSAAAALAAVLGITGQVERWHSQQRVGLAAFEAWSIDVPFESGGQIGVIHAEFSERPSSTLRP